MLICHKRYEYYRSIHSGDIYNLEVVFLTIDSTATKVRRYAATNQESSDELCYNVAPIRDTGLQEHSGLQ
jgi:hypothetical protein